MSYGRKLVEEWESNGNIHYSVMDNQIQVFNCECIHLSWVSAIHYVTGTVIHMETQMKV